jgi:tetratricopeptide (TPR) repeat protein
MPSLQQLHKLLAADPNDAFVLYGLAQEHFKLAQYPQAIEFYDRCIAVDPGYCYAYYHKAKAQEAAGQVEAARATVVVGMKAAKTHGDSHAFSELSALDLDLS